MPEYLYYCAVCDYYFDVKKSMYESARDEKCPKCGLIASRRYTPIPNSFGWRLSDRSYEIGGPRDEFVRDV